MRTTDIAFFEVLRTNSSSVINRMLKSLFFEFVIIYP